MKNPTQDLIEEHGGIMLMLKIMEKVAAKLKNDQVVEKDHLRKIAEFLSNFADKCHHGKEEGILFPTLLATLSNTKIINELLGEHQTGRDYIRGIVESLESYQPGNSHAYHIAINMLGYAALLTDHIRKENTLLFPIADKELSAQQKASIENRFENLERDVIGPGKHEEYHGWLSNLEAIYLK